MGKGFWTSNQNIPINHRIHSLIYDSNLMAQARLRRLRHMDHLIGDVLFNKGIKYRILEVGCGDGRDFVTWFADREDLDIHGLDLTDFEIDQSNFKLVIADAERIEYPDKYFDLVISIGVLEHIQPIEKLSKVIKEIDRVSKSYIVGIPSIDTFIEPHTMKIRWQLRDHNKKDHSQCLNYYSDEAWLQFEGFIGANTNRFDFIPGLIGNLFVYRNR